MVLGRAPCIACDGPAYIRMAKPRSIAVGSLLPASVDVIDPAALSGFNVLHELVLAGCPAEHFSRNSCSHDVRLRSAFTLRGKKLLDRGVLAVLVLSKEGFTRRVAAGACGALSRGVRAARSRPV